MFIYIYIQKISHSVPIISHHPKPGGIPAIFVPGAQILVLQPSLHPPAVRRAPARCRPEKPRPLGASQSRPERRQQPKGQQAGKHGLKWNVAMKHGRANVYEIGK